MEYAIKNLDGEFWRYVVGYDYFMVSNMGRIKSLPRPVSEKWIHKYKCKRGEYLMSGTVSKKGYINVCLSVKGKVKVFQLHRLVAAAFIEN